MWLSSLTVGLSRRARVVHVAVNSDRWLVEKGHSNCHSYMPSILKEGSRHFPCPSLQRGSCAELKTPVKITQRAQEAGHS